jgi:uracil-DNA glycosylase
MIGNQWDKLLENEYVKSYFVNLKEFVEKEYKDKTIYPQYNNIFNAFKYTDYKEVKVVILGQDPYHGVGEAHGLSFSVLKGVKIPPSLKNIYKELRNDLGLIEPSHGNLEAWANEGVLLLNSVLTVEKDKPGSHRNKGWEIFTNKIIEILNHKEDPIVFILWGNYAKQKKELITKSIHKIIESPHPSPFSANKGFFFSKPFSKTNQFLKENQISEINWKIK